MLSVTKTIGYYQAMRSSVHLYTLLQFILPEFSSMLEIDVKLSLFDMWHHVQYAMLYSFDLKDKSYKAICNMQLLYAWFPLETINQTISEKLFDFGQWTFAQKPHDLNNL